MISSTPQSLSLTASPLTKFSIVADADVVNMTPNLRHTFLASLLPALLVAPIRKFESYAVTRVAAAWRCRRILLGIDDEVGRPSLEGSERHDARQQRIP